MKGTVVFDRDIAGIRNQRSEKGVSRQGNRSQELLAKWKGRDTKEWAAAIVIVFFHSVFQQGDRWWEDKRGWGVCNQVGEGRYNFLHLPFTRPTKELLLYPAIRKAWVWFRVLLLAFTGVLWEFNCNKPYDECLAESLEHSKLKKILLLLLLLVSSLISTKPPLPTPKQDP